MKQYFRTFIKANILIVTAFTGLFIGIMWKEKDKNIALLQQITSVNVAHADVVGASSVGTSSTGGPEGSSSGTGGCY